MSLGASEASPATLPTLPFEVKEKIIELAAREDERYKERWVPDAPGGGLVKLHLTDQWRGRSLAALSETCKELNELAAAHLFHIITDGTDDSTLFATKILERYSHHFRSASFTHERGTPSYCITFAGFLATALPNITHLRIEYPTLYKALGNPALFHSDQVSSPISGAEDMARHRVAFRALAHGLQGLTPINFTTHDLIALLKLCPELRSTTIIRPRYSGADSEILSSFLGSVETLRHLTLEAAIGGGFTPIPQLDGGWVTPEWSNPLDSLKLINFSSTEMKELFFESIINSFVGLERLRVTTTNYVLPLHLSTALNNIKARRGIVTSSSGRRDMFLKNNPPRSTTSHKRKSEKSTGKVAVIDLTLDSDADPSPDSDSDIEILPSKKRAKGSTSHLSKPSPTKYLQRAQPNSSSRNGRAGHHTGATALSAGSSEQGISEVGGLKGAIKAKKDTAELDKTRKDRAFAVELEKARRLRKEAAAAQKELDKKTKKVEKREGIEYKVLMGEGRSLLENPDDARDAADNLPELSKVKEIFKAGLKSTRTDAIAGLYPSRLKIKKVTRLVNHALERRFNEARQALINAGRSTKELMLFHGTPPQNIPIIAETGFKIPNVGGARNIGHGFGEWLARNPLASHLYCQGGTQMSMSMLNKPPLGAGKETYDSFSGDTGGFETDVYVLPTYIIEFSDGRANFPPAPDPEELYRAIYGAAGFGDFF
ncbi:hypothetical protein RQP46_009822 [Phenoliferia psychrophenolica]